MSVPSSALSLPAIVTRLRAAGCVFAEDEAVLIVSTARTPADLAVMVDRRALGHPLEHVLGWADFCGLRIAVDPGVFVPRRRTEFLVTQAAALPHPPTTNPPETTPPTPDRPETTPPAADRPETVVRAADRPETTPPSSDRPETVVVDLCCGTGALGAALAAALGPVELHAVDLDPAAVRCARRNLAAAGGRVHRGDLYEPLPASLRGRVDFLVASPPYVPTEAIRLLPTEARIHEPRVALDGGADGLDIVRRVIAEAAHWLSPGGHLLVETSEHQAPQAVETLTAHGLLPRTATSEDLNATVLIGTRGR
ncbi:methylase [Microtetraspora sp. NBRC 13810]|uniref:putative protein N(5)-glutamine methyltransferase n=1 Tax=Microtetraspora sp. NBRC 13810 TaxID=3030990 RepID=UPI0024A235BB|nr:putative protein N(5)-glutamine methyltransferase [Microtetraspora sp. NBRC 13810]GLW11224.1 methylase [Microtetraspora sp. NBRC 13810]